MTEKKRTYDSTVARIAGNIASGLMDRVLFLRDGSIDDTTADNVAVFAVALARAIVAEVERTEPDPAAEGVRP